MPSEKNRVAEMYEKEEQRFRETEKQKFRRRKRRSSRRLPRETSRKICICSSIDTFINLSDL